MASLCFEMYVCRLTGRPDYFYFMYSRVKNGVLSKSDQKDGPNIVLDSDDETVDM